MPTALLELSRQTSPHISPRGLEQPGRLYKYDVSIRVSQWNEFVDDIKTLVRSASFWGVSSFHRDFPILSFYCFGHMGDENLHLNLILKGADILAFDLDICRVQQLLDTAVYGAVISRGGSISAEHGIGQLKHLHLQRAKSSAELFAMQSLKKLFDPECTLNPGKLIVIDE